MTQDAGKENTITLPPLAAGMGDDKNEDTALVAEAVEADKENAQV